MYLFCMLELLNGSHWESDDVERVFRFLGPLKDNEDMMWIRQMTIQQLCCEWNDGSKLEVESWLRCHDKCEITEVLGLISE